MGPMTAIDRSFLVAIWVLLLAQGHGPVTLVAFLGPSLATIIALVRDLRSREQTPPRP